MALDFSPSVVWTSNQGASSCKQIDTLAWNSWELEDCLQLHTLTDDSDTTDRLHLPTLGTRVHKNADGRMHARATRSGRSGLSKEPSECVAAQFDQKRGP